MAAKKKVVKKKTAKKKAVAKRPVGRPTDFNKDLMDVICSRISLGESMRSICRDDNMPVQTTMFRWLRERSEFKQQYDLAKEESAESLADEMTDIADNECTKPLMIDGKPMYGDDGKPIMVVDSTAVQHAKLRIDTRKWAASKLKPRKFGDKIQNENVNVEMTHEQWLESLK